MRKGDSDKENCKHLVFYRPSFLPSEFFTVRVFLPSEFLRSDNFFRTVRALFYLPEFLKEVFSRDKTNSWWNLNLWQMRASIRFTLIFGVTWCKSYIVVGDGCKRRNALVTTIRCCWRFWSFWSPTSTIFWNSKDVTNLKILSPN